MSRLELTQKTNESAEILIYLSDKTMTINLNKVGVLTQVILSSSASTLVFCYASSLIYDDLVELSVQHIYNFVHNNFINLISEDASQYQIDNSLVPYDVSQCFRAYRRNLPVIENTFFQTI